LNRRRFAIEYLLSDFICSGLVWTLFYIFRKIFIEPAKFGYSVPVEFGNHFWLAIIILPTYWVVFYWLSGSYRNISKKSRIKELFTTAIISFIGTIIIFFLLLLDDEVKSYEVYRYTFITLLGMQFFIVAIARLTILTIIKSKIAKRIISFNTLIVGSNKKVLDLYQELENEKHSQGYKFIGYVTVMDKTDPILNDHLENLGTYTEIMRIIEEQKVEVVIIAIDTSEHEKLNYILSLVEGSNVNIKIIPDMYDLISGKVKMNYIFGTVLIDISPEIIPAWQKNIKRFMDFSISLLVLIMFLPFFTIIALAIKLNSRGPAIYKQERIGKNSKPFTIYKFRTMNIDTPPVATHLMQNPSQYITPFGQFLRKTSLDELPQLFNILRGDMSFVGPRPALFNQHDLIELRTKKGIDSLVPGLTGWAQINGRDELPILVKVEYDEYYCKNRSFFMDVQILFMTFLKVLRGEGVEH